MSSSRIRWIVLGLTLAAGAAVARADFRIGCISTVFDAIAHQFYEVPRLAKLRQPSQLVLIRWNLAIAWAMAVLNLAASILSGRHWRNWLWIILAGLRDPGRGVNLQRQFPASRNLYSRASQPTQYQLAN